MIEFRDVSKEYGSHVHALHHVNFSIEAGEFVFLIGESGAGKSTVIKLLTCEEECTSGSVFLDNYDISHMKRKLVPYLRRRIGLIFQDFRLIESKNVFENVAFAMEIVGAPYRLIERRVPIVLSLVGLRDKTRAYPNELSGGEAQRVGIARAMVNNPRLILADEPTGNLDQANSEAIMSLLDDINRTGTTVIACTHDLRMVERMNKRVLELSKGRIIRDERPRDNLVNEVDMHSGFTDAYERLEENFKESGFTGQLEEFVQMSRNSLNRSGGVAMRGDVDEMARQLREAHPHVAGPDLSHLAETAPLPRIDQIKRHIKEDQEKRKRRKMESLQMSEEEISNYQELDEGSIEQEEVENPALENEIIFPAGQEEEVIDNGQ